MITGTIKTSEPAATTEKMTVPAPPAVAAGSDDLVRDLLVDRRAWEDPMGKPDSAALGLAVTETDHDRVVSLLMEPVCKARMQ
jgi:hypothetical protein